MLNMVTLALIVAEIGRTLRQTGITQSVLLVIQIRNVNFVSMLHSLSQFHQYGHPKKMLRQLASMRCHNNLHYVIEIITE